MYKTRVLLVDDEPRLLETLQEILDLHGFETAIASDGLRALEVSQQFYPDIVLCDIMMPKMDGFVFFHQFRKANNTDTPFIFLTAKSEYSDIRTGMLLGADDYLVKPIKGQEVIQAIQTRLSRHSQILSPEMKRVEKLEQTIGLITMHEFKNPMTAIIGFLDLIKSKIDTIKKADLEEYLSYIEQGANRIISLLAKVTTWHQLQSPVNQLNHGSTRTELSHVVAQMSLEIAKKYHRINDLTLHLKYKPLINLSPELIKACFSELIDNAFKFSDSGDMVQVSVLAENMKCIVTIEDNGKRSCASKLMEYEPFTQFDKKKFEQQGLGIGIHISKSIADLVKAEIEFLNKIPNGIIAKISIPINE